jgi:choline dehydrogenase
MCKRCDNRKCDRNNKCKKDYKDSLCYDYVIVGAGAAGCALAAKLSDPDSTGRFARSVLVLEAGENLTQDPRVIGSNNIITAVAQSNDPALSVVDLTYPQGKAVNPFNSFPYTEGRMWGGSSGHSYAQAIRATPTQLDFWVAVSGDANLLDTVIKPLEHYTPDGSIANPTQRGFNGSLFITQEPFPRLANSPFYQAVAAALEVPIVTDYNDPSLGEDVVSSNQDYVTPPFLGPNSYRSYAANQFLTGEPGTNIPAIVDANGNGLNGRKLKIISNAHVNRVLFSSSKRAKGVEYVVGGARDSVMLAQAKKQVILCAGGINDPAILQRSGVGDPAVLNPLNIPVVFANTNVGANMTDPAGQQGIIGGVTSGVPLPAYGLAFTDFAETQTKREYFWQFYEGLLAFPNGIAQALGITQGIDVLITNWDPASRGSVQIISKDPFVQPLINFNFFSDPTDVSKMITAYSQLQDIAAAAGGTVLYPTPEIYAGGQAALLAASFATLVPFNHISSTCRMAKTAATGVVDGTLRVFGVSNLMVASSSVEPQTTCGTNVAEMIGVEASRIILGL